MFEISKRSIHDRRDDRSCLHDNVIHLVSNIFYKTIGSLVINDERLLLAVLLLARNRLLLTINIKVISMKICIE